MEWFGNGQQHGIAVILGRASGGLVCRDYDVLEAYNAWAALHPELAATLPTVATARGRHVYFRSSHEKFIELEDGKIRSNGHYCLLPPSRHPDGPVYRWLNPLPNGPLPVVEDLDKAGFCDSSVTEASFLCYRAKEAIKRKVTTSYVTMPTTSSVTIPTTPSVTLPSISSVTTQNTSSVTLENDSSVTFSEKAERKFFLKEMWIREIQLIIKDTLPTVPGRRNRKVFEFAQTLKALSFLVDATANNLKPFVREWHSLALPNINTKLWEETWSDFVYAWSRVKFPKGTQMSMVLAKAAAAGIPKEAEQYEQPKHRLLISLCRELQRAAGDEPFYLSCRMAGKLLEVDHMTANRWLCMLANDGVLKVAQKFIRGKLLRFA